jgi:hypothetical protein
LARAREVNPAGGVATLDPRDAALSVAATASSNDRDGYTARGKPRTRFRDWRACLRSRARISEEYVAVITPEYGLVIVPGYQLSVSRLVRPRRGLR